MPLPQQTNNSTEVSFGDIDFEKQAAQIEAVRKMHRVMDGGVLYCTICGLPDKDCVCSDEVWVSLM